MNSQMKPHRLYVLKQKYCGSPEYSPEWAGLSAFYPVHSYLFQLFLRKFVFLN